MTPVTGSPSSLYKSSCTQTAGRYIETHHSECFLSIFFISNCLALKFALPYPTIATAVVVSTEVIFLQSASLRRSLVYLIMYRPLYGFNFTSCDLSFLYLDVCMCEPFAEMAHRNVKCAMLSWCRWL